MKKISSCATVEALNDALQNKKNQATGKGGRMEEEKRAMKVLQVIFKIVVWFLISHCVLAMM